MMKQLSDLRIVYPASPDKRTDYIPQPKHSKPVTDPSQLPMALNAKQVAAVLGISRAGAYNPVHRQAHGGSEGQVDGLDEHTNQNVRKAFGRFPLADRGNRPFFEGREKES